MYKWLTAIIKFISDKHLQKHKLMQIDQRGAAAGVSGTTNNLLIDDMVQRDALMNRRNLFTFWIDVRKAFDSVSHSWLLEMLKLHRFPTKIISIVKKIITQWNIVLVIPMENGNVESGLIRLTNGELQGDTFCPNLYTLCNNPLSWKLRSLKGYMMSKPIKEKVTHSLFIDDLKGYSNSMRNGEIIMNTIKPLMADSGLEWNAKKSMACYMSGAKVVECDEMIMEDGTKIAFLKPGETYKFMGVHQSNETDMNSLEKKLITIVEQRSHIVWSSNLSDHNKVLACNVFVNSSLQYYFWSCKFRIDFLKEMDRCVRKVMNVCGAKHTNVMNESLYLPRNKGGRGLRSIENMYKEVKIKSAVKVKVDRDPRMEMVNKFHQIHLSTNSYSLYKEAKRYCCEEKELEMRCDTDIMSIRSNDEELKTDDEKFMDKLKVILARQYFTKQMNVILNSTWQGVIMKSRIEDEHIMSGCYSWLENWRGCPTTTVSEVMLLLYQTLSTKCFLKYRLNDNEMDTKCRLCHSGDESVKHLLSNCGELAKKIYVDRHNNALKCFFLRMLAKYGFCNKTPCWYSAEKVKPSQENESCSVFWDIPEYTGRDEEDETSLARPDGKVILKTEKKIFLIEMTVPWIENREIKYEHKTNKYKTVQTNLRLDYPGYEIDQVTLVMDVLGGHSKNLVDNITKIFGDKTEVRNIIRDMQKSVINSAAHLVRVFKLRTST